MIAEAPTKATAIPDSPVSNAGSMNFTSTSPENPRPNNAINPRSRATRSTTTCAPERTVSTDSCGGHAW